MPSPEELYALFNSFPGEERVDEICKKGQGEATCRYLAIGPNGYLCEKNGTLRGEIDKRFKEGSMGSKGDNCGGLITFIEDNKDLLVGNEAHYLERDPDMDLVGNLQDLTEKPSTISIDGQWDLGVFGLQKSETLIEVDPRSINLSIRGLGTYAGKAEIYYTKPSEE